MPGWYVAAFPPPPRPSSSPTAVATPTVQAAPIGTSLQWFRRGSRERLDVGSAGRHRRRPERLVLAQDRLLQVAQALARLDPELFDEALPCLLVDLECLGLAAGAVESEHQLRAEALSQGVLAHQELELANEIGVAAKRQVDVDTFLDRP